MTRQIIYHYQIESMAIGVTVDGFEYASDKQALEIGPKEMALELGIHSALMGPIKIYRVATSFGEESFWQHDPVEITGETSCTE